MESIILCSKVTCSANSLSFHRNNPLLGLDERWRKKSIQQIVPNSGRNRLMFLSANKSVKSNTTTACFSPDAWIQAHEADVKNVTELDGEKIANKMLLKIESDTERFIKISNDVKYRPRLAIVSVGKKDGDDDDDSQTLVGLVKKACEKGGLIDWSPGEPLSAKSTEDELLKVVKGLNREREVYGIMVQLPLPQDMDKENIMNSIDHEKNVHIAFAVTPVVPLIVVLILSFTLDSAIRFYERDSGLKFER